MSAQEFILIPRENYITNQPKALEVLDDPTISEKAHQLTLLQRIPQKEEKEKEKPKETKPNESTESIQKRVLRSITMLNPHQTIKSKSILEKLQSSPDVSINEEGVIEIDENPTAIDASNFLYTLQQPTKKLHHPDYKRILEKINVSQDLVPNTEAKEIVRPKVPKTKVVTLPKSKLGTPTPKKLRKRNEQQISPDSKEEEEITRRWDTFTK